MQLCRGVIGVGIVCSSVVEAGVEEVFRWHGRPGALVRLAPPWQPVTVVREAGSLRDGVAVLGLPGGLRWVARHDPAGYEAPHRFVDELDSLARYVVRRWRHSHEFTAEGSGTRITDRVDTAVPAAVLTGMFGYRQRQLAGDLAAHRWAAAYRAEPLTVAVTGSSGLVGTALAALLSTGGHRVVRLVRGPARGRGERRWDPDRPDRALLDGVDALVHLAGAPIGGRFTPRHRRSIMDSRVGPTRRLAGLAAASGVSTMVSASAIGYYGADRGDEVLAEEASPGTDFLAEVAVGWEEATGPAAAGGVRVVRVRTGIVQTPAGGALRLLRPVFAAGLGGRLGDGRQWMPWIGLDDLLDVYLRALVDARLDGPVNAVAPRPVRNAEYGGTLARVMRRWAVLPTPTLGPRLLLGEEGARELAYANQRVVPARLTELGHGFRHAELYPALRHVLGREPAMS